MRRWIALRELPDMVTEEIREYLSGLPFSKCAQYGDIVAVQRNAIASEEKFETIIIVLFLIEIFEIFFFSTENIFQERKWKQWRREWKFVVCLWTSFGRRNDRFCEGVTTHS